MRVLILDDDSSVRQTLILGLTNFGYQSVSCSTAKEAFDRVEKEKIDFVLSDYKMPEMTGLEFVSRMRRISQIPVMIMTGYSHAIDDAKAGELGIPLILNKPFSLAELGAALKKMSSFVSLHPPDEAKSFPRDE